MNIHSIDPITRIALLVGAIVYLLTILFLLKHKKLTVRYAIIWLASAGAFLVFAVWPYTVLVLRDLLKMEMPVNVVFTLVIAFMLLLLLSLSSIASGFAEKLRRMAQQQALLERRVRDLETSLAEKNRHKDD
ncbi:MAG: DUF2304 domain-containing protein [Ruthenibacterium sp.]